MMVSTPRGGTSGVTLVLNLGEVGLSSRPDDVLKIVALGSCVALCVWCSQRRVGAMAHVVLPDSATDLDLARRQPGYFADTAVPLILRAMTLRHGCVPEALGVRLVGGAAVLQGMSGGMDIGRRNAEALTRLVPLARMRLDATHLGGSSQRTIAMSVATGQLQIETEGRRFML